MNEELEREFAEQPEGLKTAVPAFKFTRHVGEVIHELPAPGLPFGLILKGTIIKDAHLKDLTTLTKLQALDLSNTHLTDVGTKDLAR